MSSLDEETIGQITADVLERLHAPYVLELQKHNERLQLELIARGEMVGDAVSVMVDALGELRNYLSAHPRVTSEEIGDGKVSYCTPDLTLQPVATAVMFLTGGIDAAAKATDQALTEAKALNADKAPDAIEEPEPPPRICHACKHTEPRHHEGMPKPGWHVSSCRVADCKCEKFREPRPAS